MAIKVGFNGVGRIGNWFSEWRPPVPKSFSSGHQRPSSRRIIWNICLNRYDSWKVQRKVSVKDNKLVVNGQRSWSIPA
jgi:hypothetical protein